MKDEEKEKKLISLLAVERPEAFWTRQKKEIIGTVSGKRMTSRAWLLVPATAMAGLLVFAAGRGSRQVVLDEAPSVSTAFLENLDLLDDMDVLEAIPEGDL